jgi:hypothetical protein
MYAYLLVLFHACPSDLVLDIPSHLSAVSQKSEQAASDLCFGQKQVEQFIVDRPKAGRFIKNDHILRATLIWHFAGQLKGERVYWDCKEPKGPPTAEHSPAMSGYPVMVRVSKDKMSPIDQCFGLLFELFNYEVDEEYRALRRSTIASRKTRDDFVQSVMKCEFEALKKTHIFFFCNPINEADFREDHYYFSGIFFPRDFSEYVLKFNDLDDNDFSPLKYYAEAYDQLVPKQN